MEHVCGNHKAVEAEIDNLKVKLAENNDVRDIPHKNVKPVTCSNKEASTPGNWCNNAAKVLYNEDTTDYNNCPLDIQSKRVIIE